MCIVSSNPDTALDETLRVRLQTVEDRLRSACRRAGRSRAEVTLVAVTKTVSSTVAARLPVLGVCNLGENRPQELWRKAAVLAAEVGIQWHLIGHLQRNKIERTLPLVRLIHSVDSLRLLDALEFAASQRQEPVAVLLQVNASRERAKHGFAPEELPGLAGRLEELQHVQLQGLMTMAAYDAEADACRATFAEVRMLCEQLRRQLEPRHSLEQLSMGMSNDFEIAVEEGATLVRVGSALFEGLPNT